MKTEVAKLENVKRDWYLVDAQDAVLGRLATQVANVLRGKNKPIFTPSVDTGDFVVVINAEKVRFTGNKWDTQKYSSYSRYPGGLKVVGAKELLARRPERILELAVKRMVPRTKLGNAQMTKLKIYAGGDHPHQAQKPIAFPSK
jgi:large subunit ribosomal protein L13